MKKIIKFLLAFSVTAQSFASFSAFAANGWTVSYFGTTNTNRDNYYAVVSEESKYEGDSAMEIRYGGAPVAGNYVEIKGSLNAELTDGAEYTLVFYNKGSASSFTDICIGNNITVKYADMVKESASDSPSGETSWSKYTYNFTYSDGGEDYILFRFSGRTTPTRLDSVGIFEKNSIENLVVDSGFEGVEEEAPSEEPFDTTEYQAHEFIAAPGNGKIGLSWVNPVTGDLSDVELYDITNGEWILLSDEISNTPSAVINYPVEGLTNGASYRFAVKFEFKSKPAFTYFVSGSPASGNVAGIGDKWRFEDFKNGAAGYCPANMSLSDDTMSGDGYSVRFRTNIDKTVPDLSGNIYLRYYHSIEAEANANYKLTFKAKCEGIDGKIQLLWNWNPFDEYAPSWACPELTGTKDWAEYEYTLTSGDKTPAYVHFLSDVVGTLYLDDIEMYKLDENGEKTGDNLFEESTFDGLYNDEVGMIDSVDVIDCGMNNVTYTNFASEWTEFTKDYTPQAELKNIQFQTWYGDRCIDNVSVRNLGEGEGSFWIENAFTLTDEWTEYTILLDNNDNANANGAYLYDMEKEGSYDARLLLSTDCYTGKIWIDDVAVYEVDADDTVTVKGDNLIIDGGFETPELILSDAVFSVNGEKTDKLVTGTMNVSVTAVNEGNLLLIVALYKDGALYSTSVMEKTTSALSENYNTSIAVPALTDGVYTGKVFYWNGSSTLSAHRLPATIAE